MARQLDFAFFAGSDLKQIISVVGFDLTGVAGVFDIADAPGADVRIAAAVSLLEVSTDDDGVPTSVMQAFASQASIAAAVTAIDPADPGADLPLYYEFRVSSLPGEVGSDAETTLLFGTATLKGSVQ